MWARQIAAGVRRFAILPSSAGDGKTRPRRREFPMIERPHGEIPIPKVVQPGAADGGRLRTCSAWHRGCGRPLVLRHQQARRGWLRRPSSRSTTATSCTPATWAWTAGTATPPSSARATRRPPDRDLHELPLEGEDRQPEAPARPGELGHADTPIPWVRVHNLPDYVYFDHQRPRAGGRRLRRAATAASTR